MDSIVGPYMFERPGIFYLKLLCSLACLMLLASNIWSMSHWSERRGVADDLCYIRQAHLFQKSGIDGLRTDLNAETDGYFKRLVTETGHPEWDTPEASVCHITMAGTGMRVIQYPPGPGFMLAMFREGFQAIPYHVGSATLVALVALIAIAIAASPAAVAAASVFGLAAIYFMINPAKASYSIPPTMVICALAGFLTAKLDALRAPETGRLLFVALGLLLGLSVNFRIANLLLSAGYLGWLLFSLVNLRNLTSVANASAFGIAYLVAMAPTLLANAINAGSPYRTTYGGGDVQPPDWYFSITGEYLRDVQGLLILLAMVWTIRLAIKRSSDHIRPGVLVTTINLVVNLAFFLSHPVFTQYYLMPLAMLSLWSLLFTYLLNDHIGQAQPRLAH